MKIALIQTDIYWESPDANRAELEEKISQINESFDLIVLPEMFTTGFSMKPNKIAEPHNFHTEKWMKMIAQQYQTAICGSIAIKEKEGFYNTLKLVNSNGEVFNYNKKHTFSIAGESEVYTNGLDPLVVDIKGVKIKFAICYDLRFPIWLRNNKDDMYDVLIVVANWPASRVDVWQPLLKARALENLSYTVGVNRIGQDGNEIEYSGDSLAFDFKGNEMERLTGEEIKIIEINTESIQDFRNKFPAHLDADGFEIH